MLVGFTGCEKTVFKMVYQEDETPPKIVAEPEVTTTDSAATIAWVTDEPANGTVKYGRSPGDYDSTVTEPDEYSLNHSFTISNLIPHTTYYFIVESVDFYRNGPTITDEQSFITKYNEYTYMDSGWTEFARANSDSAISNFKNARAINPNYADPYTGLGWCYARLDSLTKSTINFTTAIEMNFDVDAYAGRSGVNLKMGDAISAIDDARITLELDSLYVFSHDTTITYLDLHLILAEGYYFSQQYSFAHQQVEYLANVFNLTFNLDENDNTTWSDPEDSTTIYSSYLEVLLVWIQYLKDLV